MTMSDVEQTATGSATGLERPVEDQGDSTTIRKVARAGDAVIKRGAGKRAVTRTSGQHAAAVALFQAPNAELGAADPYRLREGRVWPD